MERAWRSLSTTAKASPASGREPRPRISAGAPGGTDLIDSPWSLVIALIRPKVPPAVMYSPSLRVPSWTSSVASGPRLRSSLASIITPVAGLSGLALSSATSATTAMFCSRSSNPSPVRAETSTEIISPPQSSTNRSRSLSWRLTLSGSAPGRSILLIATIMGTLAALAWLIASSV